LVVTGKEVSVHPVRPRSDDTRDLAARLAPLEELRESKEPGQTNDSQVVAQENGAIVVGVEQPEVAKEVGAADERNRGSRLEPVVIVIVVLMLAFIVFIAWQISQMPAQQVIK
jgi:hypothetical protein